MTAPVGEAEVGLTRSARCVDLSEAWATHLERIGLEGLLDHLDRAAEPYTVPAHAAVEGIVWDAHDRRDPAWYPQGITTSGDATDVPSAGDRRIIVTSWYGTQRRHRPSLGARLSFIDYTDPEWPRYRHVLLVEPFRDGAGGLDLRPVPVHAGGICWYGSFVLVAGTWGGVRVFDLGDITAVPGALDDDHIGRAPDGRHSTAGYAFVLPQAFGYDAWSEDASAALRYSFLSLDRSADPHHLVAGEYGRAGADARLFHFALEPATGLLRSDGVGASRPVDVLGGQAPRMQGAVRVGDRYVITASRGRRTRGDLWTGRSGQLTLHRGVLAIGPEDLTYWPDRQQLWTLSEWPTRRWVYALDARRWLAS